MAQSVTAESDPSSTVGSGGGYGFNGSRSASSAFSPLRQRPQLGPRARSASSSNLQDIPERAVRFRDDTELDQRNSEQDVLSELIDFLRNHAPPSDNFMSIPDQAVNDDRGRWSMLKRLAPISKRKGILKSPQNIQLPDSAVSGTTIGGHRHIAISIPLSASPFGVNPRSQYPIYQNRAFKPITSRYTPTRAYVNEKGIVTVLQGITEDRESPVTRESPLAMNPIPRYQLSPTYQQSQGDSGNPTYNPAAIPKSSTTSRIPDYSTLVRSLSHASDRDNRDSEILKQPQKETPAASPPNYRASLPARASSLTTGRALFPESSIDAVIFQRDSLEDSAAPPDITRTASRDSLNHSLSKSIETTGDDPVVSEAQQVRASKSSPVLVREFATMTPKKRETTPVTVITQSPLIGTERRKSPTPSARSTQSRREKVRARKLKDLEAARNVVQRRQSEQSQASDAQSIPTPPAKSVLRPKSIRMDSLPMQERPQSPTMSSIMVVADVHPSPPLTRESTLVQEITGRPQTPPRSSKSISGGDTASKRDASLNSNACVNGSNNPTPPQSDGSGGGSPPHRRSSMDRTSLSRRREWNESREKERKEREQLRKAQAIRAKARQLGINQEEPEGNSKLLPMEQDVLRRYEAYREYRIREMERRVRRLERNGDVWLRALVPVLDNLNRTLANVQQEQPKQSPSQAQGWVSDDSTGGSQDARGRSLGYRRQQVARDKAARRGTSERQFLEQLVKQRDELAGGSNSDDMSGFDTIEPLMRELAGRSRLSFEARKTLGVDKDGGLISTC